jgi:hypothetical protein
MTNCCHFIFLGIMESPAISAPPSTGHNTTTTTTYRKCPTCSLTFRGSNLNGYGSHTAACRTRAESNSKTIKPKRMNCVCHATCASIPALREHQLTCPTYQYKREEREHRHFMYDPERIANEAFHVALDHTVWNEYKDNIGSLNRVALPETFNVKLLYL